MDFVDFISKLGFPIAAAACLGYIMYRLLSRLVDRHIKHLDKVDCALEKLVDKHGEIQLYGHRIDQHGQRMIEQLEEIKTVQKNLSDSVKKFMSNVS